MSTETAEPSLLSDMIAEETPAPDPVQEAPEPEHDSQLDDLELQVAHREWTVAGEFEVQARDGTLVQQNFEKTYMQKPLSYTAMLQFTGLIGERISEAMSGPEGLTLDGVINDVEGMGAARNMFSREDFSGMDAFVKGLAKLAIYAPSVIEDCQCIWLRVPLAERPIVKEIWARSPVDGGLSIDDGEEMLEVFLAQNYAEVEDFFVVRLRRLLERVSRLRAKKELRGTDSPRSKRSKPTQTDIPSP